MLIEGKLRTWSFI